MNFIFAACASKYFRGALYVFAQGVTERERERERDVLGEREIVLSFFHLYQCTQDHQPLPRRKVAAGVRVAVNKQVIHLSKIEMVRGGARGKEEMEKEREREREKAGFRFGPPLRHSARYPALPSLSLQPR